MSEIDDLVPPADQSATTESAYGAIDSLTPPTKYGDIDSLAPPASPEETAKKRTALFGQAIDGMPITWLEKAAMKAALTKGGKIGDLAINVVVPISGMIGGGAIGAGVGAPEGGVGAIPGAVIGSRLGGAAGGAAADTMVQARQFIRGERTSFSPGSVVASAAIGAFIPKPISSATTVAGTLAKTVLTRAGQGALLNATHTAMSELIDGGKLNLSNIIESGAWGTLFGGAVGTVEGVAPMALNLLKSINGKTPAEATKIIAESNVDGSLKTELQKRIEEMVGYKRSQEIRENPPATPTGALAQENPPVIKSAAESARVFQDAEAMDSLTANASKVAPKITEREKNFQYQLEDELNRPSEVVYPEGAEGSAMALAAEFPPIKSAAESAKVFESAMQNAKDVADLETRFATRLTDESHIQPNEYHNFANESFERLRALKNQIDTLESHQRTVWEPENLPNMSSQAQKIYDQHGFVLPKVAMTLAGGGGGFAYGMAQPGTPEERIKLAMTYGAIGATIGYGTGIGISKMAEAGEFGGLKALTDLGVLKGLWKRGMINEALTYTHDAVPNKANLLGRESGNAITDALSQVVPAAEMKIAQQALPFVVEAKGFPGAVDAMMEKVSLSTKANPKARLEAMAALQYAKDNFENLSGPAKLHGEMTLAQAARENANGGDVLIRDGYVKHSWHSDDLEGNPLGSGRSAGSSSPQEKMRTYDTFADGIANGEVPKTLNASDLMQSRVTAGETKIGRLQWLESMKDYPPDPLTGNPLVEKVTTETRPDGKTYETAPKGYTVQRVGGQSFALLSGYGDVFNDLNNPSWWSGGPLRRATMASTAGAKSIRLVGDVYHLVRIGAMEAGARAFNALDRIRQGASPMDAITSSGMRDLDNSVETLQRMAERGDITKAELDASILRKQEVGKLVDNGLMLGSVEDASHQEFMRGIPLAGDFQKFLFTSFQRRAMKDVALMELGRRALSYGDNIPESIYRDTAKDVNTWFRNFGSQGAVRSQTGKDTTRFLVLAPQWTEGAIRSEIGAVRQGAEALAGGKKPIGLLAGATGAVIGGSFVANQIINQYTRGHPTWENNEEGVGAKISAWVPDYAGRAMGKEGPGFFINPLGIAGETAHLLVAGYEKTDDFARTLADYIRNRAAAVTSPAAVFFTHTDNMGRPVKKGETVTEMMKAAIPSPIPTQAITGSINSVVTQHPQQKFVGQFQRQLMTTVGIRADQAPSPEQRIYGLVRDFKKENKIEENPAYNGSDYQDLRTALKTGNELDASDAMDEILTKKTPQQVKQYFETLPNHPFTGSERTEGKFISSLNPEQSGQYYKAVNDRVAVARDGLKLLASRLAAKAQASGSGAQSD
jgi:hypothetical protein